MKLMGSTLGGGLLIVLALAPFLSAQQPVTAGVREVVGTEKAILPLTTKLRYTSLIMLPDAEEITDVVCGDKDNWVINSAGNRAFVKPAKEGAQTNLILVTTTGSTFSFLLNENSKAQPDIKLYVTADPDVARKPQKYVPTTSLSELAGQLAELHTDIKRVADARSEQELMPDITAAGLSTYTASLKFPYVFADLKKQADFGIDAIWNDGVSTFIHSHATDVAALYEITTSGQSQVNFTLKDGLYTVPKVLSDGVLVHGRERLLFSAKKPRE